MNSFNRAFLALLALAWIAALGAAIWLVWDQSRIVDITSSSINLNFDIVADTQAEQILATIVAGALMLPALLLLAFELKPSRRGDVVAASAHEGDTKRMQSRIDSLEKDLKDERARNNNQRDREADRTVPADNRRWHLFPRH
jgi:hypothetical protein